MSNKKSYQHCQKTLKKEISCVGVGLHTGDKISLKLKPAEADTGIVFKRTDIAGKNTVIPAMWDKVVDTRLCSAIGDDGVSIMTVEHLMAALHSMEIDNAKIEVSGSEIPAMDGSSAPFVFLIECAGVQELDAPRKVIKILKEITVSDEECVVSLTPSDEGLSVDFDIDFDAEAIGRQEHKLNLNNKEFKNSISKARTFGFLKDVERLRAAGLARGGSLENVVVVDGDTVLNKEGLRYKDEFVRHKILDAVGDLFLAGYSIIGNYIGSRSGHAHTNMLLEKLLKDKSAWELINLDDYNPANYQQDILRKTA